MPIIYAYILSKYSHAKVKAHATRSRGQQATSPTPSRRTAIVRCATIHLTYEQHYIICHLHKIFSKYL